MQRKNNDFSVDYLSISAVFLIEILEDQIKFVVAET